MFPKLEGLDSLARRDGVDIRPTLLRVLTDLYVQKSSHGAEEERHYTELALRLVDSVDLATRATIAKKLAAYAGAPHAVVRRLARDVIEVAEPVLRHSRSLTAADLDAIVRDFGAGHAAIVAERRASIPAIAAPAARQHAPTAATQNARKDSDIGLAELFFSAEPGARRALLMSLGSVESETPQSVQPVETNRALEAAALRRDRAGFNKLLQGALGISHEQAERIVGDPSGEPLLIAAKALAMPSVALQRILMFIDPAIGESVQRVFDLAGLYERISADAAHKIIASLRGHEPVRTRRPAHRPMYYDDEAARSRRGATTRRPAAAEPQAPARPETGVRQRTI
ncbi:MAG: DUF2336 domain-containing protein [Alphaproteobacteria bacterium]|nr:MAG: DUF2336 domain-containing protein [Alphaproteobacteria bacterium]